MATRTIGTGGDFSTIQSWIDSLAATLTEAEVGQCKNQSFTISSPIAFTGHTTSGANTLTLTTEAGASFRDNINKLTNALRPNAANGTILVNTASYGTILNLDNSNLTISNLQLDCQGNNSFPIDTNAVIANTVLENCIVQGKPRTNTADGYCADLVGSTTKARNCLFLNAGSVGYGVRLSDGATVQDCTVVRATASGAAASGIVAQYTNNVAVGCAVFGYSTACDTATFGGSFHASSDYNATEQSSIGTGTGTHNLTNLTYANQFVDTGGVVAGADFRLKSGANLIGSGTAVSGITADIVGTTRPQGSAEDIGAWEFSSSAPVSSSSSASVTARRKGIMTGGNLLNLGISSGGRM